MGRPKLVPTRKQFKVALVAVDFPDQTFLITLPKHSDLFGSPQIDPVPRDKVPQFYADFYNTPSPLNHCHTINGYWMERSRGPIGIAKLDVYGPLLRMLSGHQYKRKRCRSIRRRRGPLQYAFTNMVPYRTLYTGARMPAIGLGTFGSDHVPPDRVAEAVIGAAEAGYRHFDCAAVYGNEDRIGESLRAIMRGGIRREDLWIVSKLWNDKHAETDVIPSCEKSLRDLGVNYLDMYLVHWPFPNYHPPHCDVSSRSPNARRYIHENFLKTWRQMEALVETGLVRHIGTSNMTIPKLRLLLRDAEIRPAVNEMELHPHFQQPELLEFVRAHGIQPVGYCPLGSPGRPERDRTPEDTVDLEDPVILEIAQHHGCSAAAVCLKWAIGRGQTPIPFSTTRCNYESNLRAVESDPLSVDEMRAIAAIDRNCRLIKGQVFLWREGQTWEDLWDSNGEIAQ